MRRYKVFSKSPHGLFSVLTHSNSLWYSMGVKTQPRIGKVFLFDTLENALRFCNESQECEVWEVRAGGVETPRLVLRAFSLNSETFYSFWIRGSTNHTTKGMPEGTLWADWVIPIRRIL